jgi:hypothetical protein
MSELPRLSVCVIEFTSRPHLVRCLDALVSQQDAALEIIVPYDDASEDLAHLRARFPGVQFLHCAGHCTPAELRAAGARSARGPVIAFLEDHCIPVPQWTERLLAAHAAPHAAVGGAVDKGFPVGRRTDSALNWAFYLADYSRYMNPQPGGPAAGLTDCNVSYKRSALESIEASWRHELHENVVNGLLLARGSTLWLAPDVVVHEQRSLTLRSALRDRYSFGRLFGSTRVAGAPLSRRLVLAALAPVMPPLLIARVAKNLFQRRRYRLQLFRTLPALTVVATAWIVGEFVGYLTGTAAPSLRTSAHSVSPTVGAG